MTGPPFASRAIDAVLWTLALSLLTTLILLSLGPAGPRTGIFAADKLWHALAYAALTGSWLLAAVWRPGRGSGPFPRGAEAVAIGAAVLGGLLEVFQGVVGRSADPFDWLANLVGIALVYAIWLLLRRRAEA